MRGTRGEFHTTKRINQTLLVRFEIVSFVKTISLTSPSKYFYFTRFFSDILRIINCTD